MILSLLLILNLSAASLGDDCATLRRENELLRELVALYRGNPQINPAKSGPSEGSATWSTSYLTSTYTTLVTIPVSTEVPLTLNGQQITTTIVDYETKETVSTSLIPTSTLVYQTINTEPPSKESSSKIVPTSSKQIQEIESTSVQVGNRDNKKNAASRDKSKLRGSLASLKKSRNSQNSKSSYPKRQKSFSLSRSRFPGFNAGGSKFSGRFKREIISTPRDSDVEIELQPSF
eukprot:TRINITY_DN31555_c0_g1_i1.p1 TRINITY_DN31555_c0_g1~~TRINITY_DN31555_c0_g1_i1.p1  ORF type:complete len:242 (-),score=31.88 TRINITY_DN31555_c0_g1_i1:27-725(-)